jgi:GNAT superfamily N-acetyltransferase
VTTRAASNSKDAAPIVVQPATIERFDDLEPVINRACWCQYWRITAREYGPSTYASPEQRDRRRDTLRAQSAAEPVPGLVAYLGEVPVGWCGFGPRGSMQRIVESRTIPTVDDLPVWSIVCFTVPPRYRRRGVAKALLHGAIDYARAHGVVGLESYPVDRGSARRWRGNSHTGFTSMFEEAGFRRVIETASRADGLPRWLMRLELDPRDAGAVGDARVMVR